MKTKDKSWFKIESKSNGVAEVLIYDEIGMFGVSAKDFATAIKPLDGKVDLEVRMISPGGNVFDGIAIYNSLKRFKGKVTTFNDSVVASMASIIFLAGDVKHMASNALWMMHNPRGAAYGESSDMQKTAEVMDKVKTNMVSIYAENMNASEDEIIALMDAETWYDAAEALDAGLINEISEPMTIEASFDINGYGFKHVPEKDSSDVLAMGASSLLVSKDKNLEKDMKTETKNPVASDDKTDVTAAADNIDVTAIADKAGKAAADAANKRITDIHSAFAGFKADHRDLMDECIADSGVTAADAKDKLLAAISKGVTPLSQEGAILKGTQGASGAEAFAKDALNSLLARSGDVKAQESNASNSLRGHTALDLARDFILIHGGNITGLDRMGIVGAAFSHSSGDFTSLLGNVAHKSMMIGYTEAEETYDNWTRKGTLSDFKVADRVNMSLFSDLETVGEGGEFHHGTLSDTKEQIQLLTYGKLFKITRQAIINDDLGAFTRIPQLMGSAARRKVGDLVYAVLTANAAMNDGVALFHSGHSNLAGTAALPTVASLSAGRLSMRTQTDPSGKGTLNIHPKYIIVPAALDDQTRVLLASEFNPGEGSTTSFREPNSVRGMVEMISEARLDASSATAWYLAGDQNSTDTIEVAFLDGNDTPAMEQQNGFSVDGTEFKVRIDAVAKALDHRSLYKNAGA